MICQKPVLAQAERALFPINWSDSRKACTLIAQIYTPIGKTARLSNVTNDFFLGA
jgi:hypothetical protein